MRKKIIAGNWKMNHVPKEGLPLIQKISNFCEEFDSEKIEILIAPPMPYLSEAAERCLDKKLNISSQNCSDQKSGAYTGEVSAEMIKSCGADFTLIGHSERREYYDDTDEFINGKLKMAMAENLAPIFCVGEKLEERKAENHRQKVAEQLRNGLAGFSEKDLKNLIIAYEPVWAIGAGETASPEQAQEMHAFIRDWLYENYSSELAEETSILYGGSVKPDNAQDIFGQPDVDGGLIGGASLQYDSFTELIKIGDEIL